ncbi:hypothetical protein H4R24_004907 [Coemansia sp. RSA 988]|nr:hypothetical protein H4R24_004907 [Coemansia sp. RSA 988]
MNQPTASTSYAYSKLGRASSDGDEDEDNDSAWPPGCESCDENGAMLADCSSAGDTSSDDDETGFCAKDAAFVPVFSRKRTASTQALRGFNIAAASDSEDAHSFSLGSDDGLGQSDWESAGDGRLSAQIAFSEEHSPSDFETPENILPWRMSTAFPMPWSATTSIDHSDYAGSAGSVSARPLRTIGSAGALATTISSKISVDGLLSPSDSSTLVPSELRFDARSTIDLQGGPQCSVRVRRRAAAPVHRIVPRLAQLVPEAPSVPKGATVFWFRRHGFQRPWDPLFIAHWVIAAVLVSLFNTALIMYLRAPRSSNSLIWRIILAVELTLFVSVMALDLLITLRDAEAREAKSGTQVVAGDTLALGRNPDYVFKAGTPAVDPTTGACGVCNVIVSQGTRHCKLCNMCVSGYSHHCRFLCSCIGARNYQMFYAFVLLAQIYTLLTLACCVYVVYNASRDYEQFCATLASTIEFIPSLYSHTTAVAFLAALALYMAVDMAALLGLTLLLGIHSHVWWLSIRPLDHPAYPRLPCTSPSSFTIGRRYRIINNASSASSASTITRHQSLLNRDSVADVESIA